MPRATDDVGQYRTVVARPDADMHNVLARLQVELVIDEGPQARLAVVQSSRLIDRNQHVMIQVRWVGVLRGPIFGPRHRAEQPPRSGTGEMLARHTGESLDH